MPSLRDRIISCKEITEFQKKVYLELLTVPSGQTISYSELARRIGCRSPQAVGQALKKTPSPPKSPAIGSYAPTVNSEAISEKLTEK